MAVPDSAAFVCYDCKHEFIPEKVVKPMRIFLSYGHDANEEPVRCIKNDLERRGHDVWFDKAKIKAGDDWRRSITDGILNSQRVAFFTGIDEAPFIELEIGQGDAHGGGQHGRVGALTLDANAATALE